MTSWFCATASGNLSARKMCKDFAQTLCVFSAWWKCTEIFRCAHSSYIFPCIQKKRDAWNYSFLRLCLRQSVKLRSIFWQGAWLRSHLLTRTLRCLVGINAQLIKRMSVIASKMPSVISRLRTICAHCARLFLHYPAQKFTCECHKKGDTCGLNSSIQLLTEGSQEREQCQPRRVGVFWAEQAASKKVFLHKQLK